MKKMKIGFGTEVSLLSIRRIKMRKSPSQIRDERNERIAWSILGSMIIGCVFLAAFGF